MTASDQILHAVKAAQAKGKPVVVSMGGVAASGGYYISLSANRIVAQPGTITGSIGVLTGKVSFGKSLGLIGANAEMVGVGKNTLMDSPLQPFTAEHRRGSRAFRTLGSVSTAPLSPRAISPSRAT